MRTQTMSKPITLGELEPVATKLYMAGYADALDSSAAALDYLAGKVLGPKAVQQIAQLMREEANERRNTEAK